jgi:uncharacterized membrane protein
MTIETSKTLGGIGAILIFIGAPAFFVTYTFGAIIALIGLILVMVASYNLGSYYAETGIFNNALYGVIAGIIGIVIAGVTLVFAVLSSLTTFLQTIYPTWNGQDWTALQGLTPDLSNLTLDAIFPFIAGVLAAFLILWVFGIIATYLARRSLISLSAKSNVGLFSTSGLLMLIGAVLIIAVGIGLLLIWIAVLLLAIAFFQIKPQQTQPATSAAAPAQM